MFLLLLQGSIIFPEFLTFPFSFLAAFAGVPTKSASIYGLALWHKNNSNENRSHSFDEKSTDSNFPDRTYLFLFLTEHILKYTLYNRLE